ncbi:MAG: hypothetical protein Q9227_004561 [Pyrenula ochraceoflavens]
MKRHDHHSQHSDRHSSTPTKSSTLNNTERALVKKDNEENRENKDLQKALVKLLEPKGENESKRDLVRIIRSYDKEDIQCNLRKVLEKHPVKELQVQERRQKGDAVQLFFKCGIQAICSKDGDDQNVEVDFPQKGTGTHFDRGKLPGMIKIARDCGVIVLGRNLLLPLTKPGDREVNFTDRRGLKVPITVLDPDGGGVIDLLKYSCKASCR